MSITYLMLGHHGDAPINCERVGDCFEMQHPWRITCYGTSIYSDGERAVLLRGSPTDLIGRELELVKEYLNANR